MRARWAALFVVLAVAGCRHHRHPQARSNVRWVLDRPSLRQMLHSDGYFVRSRIALGGKKLVLGFWRSRWIEDERGEITEIAEEIREPLVAARKRNGRFELAGESGALYESKSELGPLSRVGDGFPHPRRVGKLKRISNRISGGFAEGGGTGRSLDGSQRRQEERQKGASGAQVATFFVCAMEDGRQGPSGRERREHHPLPSEHAALPGRRIARGRALWRIGRLAEPAEEANDGAAVHLIDPFIRARVIGEGARGARVTASTQRRRSRAPYRRRCLGCIQTPIDDSRIRHW
jgi:hypothetical protein